MLPGKIQTLSAEVVDLIAAGEVIDSLAAVVREVVENALDADANRISVAVYSDLWRVRVADNGTGMNLTDLQQAASPHSTSKICSSNDLWNITSLGFRGEALHSIAALAELEICSRLTGTFEGWRAGYNSQGEPLVVESIAIAPGTVVTVSNLFGNWQLRRQGLPSIPQQLRAIQTTIQHIALCHPHVTWQVQQNDRPWFTISPSNSAKQILPQIIKQVRVSDLQELIVKVPTPNLRSGLDDNMLAKPITSEEKPSYSENQQNISYSKNQQNLSCLETKLSEIKVLLGLPDRCHRHRPDWVRVATNGRFVRSPELEQTILAAMARTLPRDRYPICFIHLQICPSQIDWNRHPAKAEIYLHSLSYWKEKITQTIEQALRISPTNLPEALQSQRVGKLLKASEAKGGYNLNRAIEATQEDKQTQKNADIGLIELQAVAQVHNRYILAQHPTGMWLIEQHIAHERVLYEQICDRWQLVPLETPIILNYLTSIQVEQLQRIGIEVEPFGEQLWAIRNAPSLLKERSDCPDALLELSLGGDLETAQVATACRSAIRNGTALSLPEMQTLLNQWKATRNPRTCPHGRPIYLSLEESALARFFRRNWVIGKSHGIEQGDGSPLLVIG
ncbi:DNA mismatch repair endonuclease MutL [Limnofasciculus baicalensis]|uniref:DNA mismatch repair protein MutL n=1 Tax=Limnofasciculus baicalensis BBK-W-15 TaxID=2699891 RepID=A0AAE3GMZ3_9CYAN|nr:DNA mismatch repair endonuclease MutL [Limnofasciculus baicalensis]MCP2727369.1 DNA mismatch repair endonuclease MutL [Limnofasciculus baicalensis BBK-W-15]